MAEELAFKDAAAAEYDRAFAHVTAHFCNGTGCLDSFRGGIS